jgi:glucosylceramidase
MKTEFVVVSIATLILAMSTSCSKNNSGQHNEDSAKKTEIEIHVSSPTGDRLTQKNNKTFSDTNLQVPAITVNEGTVYQTIEGFGASFNEAGMICLNALNGSDQNRIFESLFDSIRGSGFTLMKSPISATDFASAGPWYSYNETADDTLMSHFSIERDLRTNGLIPYIKKAQKFGNFKIQSPMDFAPDWMYFSLRDGEKHIKPKYYNALALYYSKYIKAYAANGITIDYINLFNEADNSWYSNITYKEIGELIKKHVAPRFNADGLSVKIQLGETAFRNEAIQKFPPVLDDPEVRPYIHSLTVHGYDWNNFQSLTDLHNRYPNIPIWQTEVCYQMPYLFPVGGPSKLPMYEFSDGEFWGNMIANDMKNWASAWIYWNMVLDENGGPWLVSPEHGNPVSNIQHPVVAINRTSKEVTYTGLYYYLSHFSRFIRPGARRIDCTGGSTQLNFVGFHNVDGSIVLNIINNGGEMDCSIKWRNKMVVQNFPAHSITTLKWHR